MICPICGSEVKEIPAGTSKKSGKPYKAFKVCSNQNCQYKPTENGVKKEIVLGISNPMPQKPDPYVEGKEKNTELMCKKDLMCAILDAEAKMGAMNAEEILKTYDLLWEKIAK